MVRAGAHRRPPPWVCRLHGRAGIERARRPAQASRPTRMTAPRGSRRVVCGGPRESTERLHLRVSPRPRACGARRHPSACGPRWPVFLRQPLEDSVGTVLPDLCDAGPVDANVLEGGRRGEGLALGSTARLIAAASRCRGRWQPSGRRAVLCRPGHPDTASFESLTTRYLRTATVGPFMPGMCSVSLSCGLMARTFSSSYVMIIVVSASYRPSSSART